MKFKILEDTYDTKSKVLLTINTNDEFWYKWEKEQNKRFFKFTQNHDMSLEVFNSDDSRELGIMSLDHLISYLQFIKND